MCRTESHAVCRLPHSGKERPDVYRYTETESRFASGSRALKAKGYNIFATGGSSKFLAENGVENTRVYWPSEEGQPQALEMLHKKEIDMVVNIPRDLTPTELENGYKIRRAAVDLNIPLVTNARLASAFINAFCSMSIDDIAIKSLGRIQIIRTT